MRQNRRTKLLELLTTRCDFLTLDQIARTLWTDVSNPKRSAAQALKRLEQEGLIDRFNLLAGTEIELVHPLSVWKPGGEEPAFSALSHQLRLRWREAPIATPAVVATTRAARQSGGRSGKRPSLSHATHDVHLNQVSLRYYLEQPEATWCREHELRERGFGTDALPDGLLAFPNGESRAIELAGRYPPTRLRQLWSWVQEDQTTLELW